MSSKKRMVSYTNEDAKDIHYYGKLREALKDYELMESIKALPDDMILEIKAYVINPYKYMAELKLYKCPTFVMEEDGEIMRKYFRKTGENVIPRYLQYEVEFNGYKVIHVRNLQAIWEGRLKDYNIIMDRAVINQMDEVKKNTQYQNRQLLKDLQIKGRTKLVKEPPVEIIAAIMKGS